MTLSGRAILCVLLGAVAVSAAADPPPAISGQQLLDRAKAARPQGEEALAAARQTILAERKALAAELQAAYDALDAARAESKARGQALTKLQTASADAEKRCEHVRGQTLALLTEAARLAGRSVAEDDSAESLEQALWEGLAEQLAAIDDDTGLTLGPAEIVTRTGRMRTVPVLRLGAFAAYACGEDEETLGLLQRTQDGPLRVAGPHLPPEHARALASAVSGEISHLPVDVSQALQSRPASEAKTLRSWLAQGGVFIAPILIVGALGLVLILERIVYLGRTRPAGSLVPEVIAAVRQGNPEAARERLGPGKTPMARVLAAGVAALSQAPDQREAALESALLAEAPRLERSLSLLAALAGVAPLLGLLGTVSGMIATFDTISSAGTGNPRLLSGGISEALITTQLGLMVAIPLLLVHAWLRRWVERREAMLEQGAALVAGLADAAAPEGTP